MPTKSTVSKALVVVAALVACACAAGWTQAATSGTVVGATVPSTVTLDTTACSTGAAVDFGQVTPGSATRTSADCVVAFGSSNATSQLLARQADAIGDPMYKLSTGALQGGWGASGVRSFDLGGVDRIYGVATMQDGGTVIVTDTTTAGSPDMLRMIRLDPSGTVDAVFGTVTLPIRDGADSSLDGLGSVIVDSSGRIVVAGSTPGHDPTLVRYLSTGAPDNTFGVSGVVSVSVTGGAFDDRGIGVSELLDGDLLLTGWGFIGAPCEGIVLRVRSDGSVETTFGGGDGHVIVDLGTAGSSEGLLDVVELQPSGTLLIGGGGLAAGAEFAIVRMSAAGVLDATFGGGDGVSHVAGVGTTGAFVDIAPMSGNRLLAMGLTNTGAQVLTRLNIGTEATLDTTFATSGIANLGTQTGWSVARMSVSKTTITAASSVVSGDRDSVVKRYSLEGVADTSFGTNGTYTIDQAPAATDQAMFVADGPDGKLLVAGTAGATADGFAFRLDATSLLGYDDAANRDWTTADTPFFGICLSSVASATATWTASSGCPTTDGTHWRTVATTSSQVATAALGISATATFRFGMRAPSSASPGAYEAPITFTALAP